MRVHLSLLTALSLAACTPTLDSTPPDRAASNQVRDLPAMAEFRPTRPAPPARSNAAMAQDFLDLAFRMESGRTLPVLSRFEGPITVRVVPGAPVSLGRDLDRLLSRLRDEAGIPITRIAGGQASITVETLPRARMQRVVPQAACFVVPRVSSWSEFRRARNSSTLDWTTLTERERVAVFIPADVAPQEIRDCLHEEISQAIGPLNDLYRLPDSVFNDDNFHAVLTGFDMLMLRVYYDPTLRSGMSEREVAARLPGLLAQHNPRGQRGGAGALGSTPRAWVDLIETALGPGTAPPRRVGAAEEALRFAQANGWNDTRLGFSYFALGRLSLGRSSDAAIIAFESAGQIFRRVDPNGIQNAHVEMQLAAFALSAGQWQRAFDLTSSGMQAAMRAQNATLLATLLMIRAEALEGMGRFDEAGTVRMDSLAWARYGFGRPEAVTARLAEIAALAAN